MASDDFLDSTQEVTITADRDALMRKAPVAPTGRAMVIVLGGPRVGHRVQLGEDECVIGRGTAAGLQLDGDAISRVHARLQWHEGHHYLVDCDSTNGSFVNYVRVGEKRLQDGDEIQIGNVLLKYLSGDNIETAYHEEFRKLVRRDALTGALNRPTFDEELRVALRRSTNDKPVCLVLFDLDHFKNINDTWGHTAGDLVLRDVGATVSSLVQGPHHFARLGGEEFAVVFFGSLDEARALGEALRKALEELAIRYEDQEIKVTTSAGIVLHDPGGGDHPAQTPAQLYEAADKRLYSAKEAGRNRVVSS